MRRTLAQRGYPSRSSRARDGLRGFSIFRHGSRLEHCLAGHRHVFRSSRAVLPCSLPGSLNDKPAICDVVVVSLVRSWQW